MKRIKSAVSLLLIPVLLLSAAATAFAGSMDDMSASEEYAILGDIDADGDITILDGTCLQLHLSELTTLSDSALLRGDTDLDGDTGIVDVTHLQRYIAMDKNAVFYLGVEIENAKAAKAEDDEAERAAREAQIAEEERLTAIQLAADERAERTRQAMKDYQKQYREYNRRILIENSIKNYKKQKGVDISEFNGDVDFEKLKAAGYTFVMIRMGWGGNRYNQDDAFFEENVRKAEEAGMPWGAYLYSYALDTKAVVSEIKHTLRLLKNKKPTMPVAFDIENDTHKAKNGMPSDQMLHDICLTYLKGIERAGYYPILYTGYHWLTGALNAQDLTGTYDIWYAQWNRTMDYQNPKVGMWQYGGEVNFLETPYIKDLNGMFDKDFCFKNYPVIITAYGYNNHPALLEPSLAPTGDQPDELCFSADELYAEDGDIIGDECPGIMGNSFRRNAFDNR